MGSAIPLAAMALLNLWAAGGWMVKKDYALAIVFLCYAIATVCFLYKDLTT